MKDPTQEFFVEDTQRSLDKKLAKCQADPAEVEMFEKFELCRARAEWVSFHDGICTIQD